MCMGVIYIGDRATGKTHLAMELANRNCKYVKVIRPEYDALKQLLYNEKEGTIKQTDGEQAIYNRDIEIQVELPAGKKQISLEWIDTPGEIWRSSWQSLMQAEWKKFLDTICQSEGIILILPPYREIIKPGHNPYDFINKQQWCNRFNRWVDFFRQDCTKIKHLVICLNKADLFCDIDREAAQLEFIPKGSRMNWEQRDAYVFQQYFKPIHSQIQQINKSGSRLAVRCFITSIKNRALLELPWIYLGSFLAK